MAVTLFDGFDYYATGNSSGDGGVLQKWTQSGGTGNNTTTTGRFTGSRCWRNGANFTNWMGYLFPGTYSSFSAGVAVRVFGWSAYGTSVGQTPFISFDSGGTYQVSLGYNTTTGLLEAFRNGATRSAGTLLGTSSTGFTISNTVLWYYVEVEVVISDTVGVFNVYLNGASVLSLSLQDTRNGAPTTINRVTIGSSLSSSNWAGMDFDDFYMTDTATRLGERKVETLMPSADGTITWTPSTGILNYAMVDEVQFSSTDYVQSSSVGSQDLYDVADLSAIPASIDAVGTFIWGSKTDAATRAITTALKSGATTSLGSDLTLASGGYLLQNRLFLTDPNTAAAWTSAAVNALQVGPKVTV